MNEIQWTHNALTSDWSATTTQGVWTIKATIDVDFDHRWEDGRGKLLHEYESPAKVLPAKLRWESGGAVAFMPDEPRASRVQALVEAGENAVEAGKKVDAEIQKDIEIVINPESHNLSAYGVSVGVYLSGVLLGADSLWGIESDSVPTEDEYICSVVEECIQEAINVATKKLEELKEISIQKLT